jgi:hypothetical protein
MMIYNITDMQTKTKMIEEIYITNMPTSFHDNIHDM